MAIITKIVIQKRNKERYSIFTDSGQGEEYAFSVDEEVLIKYGLKKGMELNDLPVAEIMLQDDIRKAYNMAIQFLSHRMRSEGEVKSHLQKKEIAEPIIGEVVQRLIQQKYLDDQEFAIAYVRTQMNTTDKGPGVIKLELKDKGVSEQIIHEALSEFALETQVEKAVNLGEKFAAKNKRDSGKMIKQKLEQLLLRKGYPFSVISVVMDEVIVEKRNDSELDALRYQGEKLQKKLTKYSGYEWKQKMKQKLFYKGFSMELIEKYLDEHDSE